MLSDDGGNLVGVLAHEAVDVQHAVQVIELVLQDPRPPPVDLEAYGATLEVSARNDHAL